MRQEEAKIGGPSRLLAALRQIIPFEITAASDRLGWVGLESVSGSEDAPWHRVENGLS